MKLKKSELYNYIKEQLKFDCYVGLHGIADSSDLINEYSDLSKVDKARNIIKCGIINKRGVTIGLTVKNFGNLNSLTQEKINYFNNYGFYSPSGDEVIVVVAIPYYFEDSKGRKLFGGYKESSASSEYADNNMPECITDYLFRDNIPSEMVMGYYCYSNNDVEVEYSENPNYYSKLSQVQKDDFIGRWFAPNLSYDVNDSTSIEKIKWASSLLGLAYIHGNNVKTPIINTIAQYERLGLLEKNSNINDKEQYDNNVRKYKTIDNLELKQTLFDVDTQDEYDSSTHKIR